MVEGMNFVEIAGSQFICVNLTCLAHPKALDTMLEEVLM